MPKENALTIYIPDEFRQDVLWAKNEFPTKPFNKILLELLHEARIKFEEEKTVVIEEMTTDDTEQAKNYYKKVFGFLKSDYKDDRDVLEILGTNKIFNMLKKMFEQVSLERPEHYNYCVDLFKKEHPKLYKIREKET